MNTITTIYDLIKTQSANHGNQTAILDTDNQGLTYEQLFNQTNYVIEQLRSFGISQQDKVAIALTNGPEMAITFLSVASGATCCPLNPNYRAREFEFFLADLDAKILITQSGVAEDAIEVANKLNIPVVNLLPNAEQKGGFQLELVTSISANETRQQTTEVASPKADDIAMILHTSGTTSTPKQVPLTHFNLCISAHNINQTLSLTADDRCLNVMPLFHIHGLVGVLLSSVSVAAAVVCTTGFKGDDFMRWIEHLKPSWYSAVPTIHQAVLARAVTEQAVIDKMSLRFIRSSSASLPAQVMADLEQMFKVPVIEAYGMTEASHQMASNPLPPLTRKPSSVGVATGIELSIMDESGNLVATGEIGEVVIKGDSITQGYLNNAEANEQGFAKGWFRTGDYGHLDPEGYLFLDGRIKEVINRGGEKIMPLEVDNVVMELQQVYQAVTFAVPHPSLGEDVATAVVLHPDQNISTTEIRDYLFDKLSDFKIPTQIIIVDEIPKGATGKLQRIGLVEKLTSALETINIPPRNATEIKIADVFKEILELDTVGVGDNFFALGGDSLKGRQVINRINNSFNVELFDSNLFQKPTIAELAPEIINMQQQAENDEIAELAEQLEDLSPEELAQLMSEIEDKT